MQSDWAVIVEATAAKAHSTCNSTVTRYDKQNNADPPMKEGASGDVFLARDYKIQFCYRSACALTAYAHEQYYGNEHKAQLVCGGPHLRCTELRRAGPSGWSLFYYLI